MTMIDGARIGWAAATALVTTLVAGTAGAWDGNKAWYDPAHGASPGGGGILGTGGLKDFTIQCQHCHIDPQKKTTASIIPSPAFDSSGGTSRYVPGQKYDIVVKLDNEYLGKSGCDQYMFNHNGFAATFEDASGKPVGALASDSGQSAQSCPKDISNDIKTGSTVTYRDCRAVMSRGGAENATSWSFSWTAPAAGTGEVTLYAGIVDGNCDMSSLGDDVRMLTLALADGSKSARAEQRRSGPAQPGQEPWAPFGFALFAVAGVFWLSHRRAA